MHGASYYNTYSNQFLPFNCFIMRFQSELHLDRKVQKRIRTIKHRMKYNWILVSLKKELFSVKIATKQYFITLNPPPPSILTWLNESRAMRFKTDLVTIYIITYHLFMWLQQINSYLINLVTLVLNKLWGFDGASRITTFLFECHDVNK